MNELMDILNELRPDLDFSEEKSLITGGVLDSFDVVALLDEINETFGISIKPKQIIADNFDSVDSIWSLIESLSK